MMRLAPEMKIKISVMLLDIAIISYNSIIDSSLLIKNSDENRKLCHTSTG